MDMLEKLEALQEALNDYVNLSEYQESGLMESFMKENKELVEKLGPMPGVPALVDTMPVFPPDDTGLHRAKRDAETSGRNYKIALGVTIAGVVVGLLLKAAGLGGVLIVLGGIGAYLMNSNYKRDKKLLEEKEKTYNQALKESQESIARFQEALKFWEKDVEKGFAQAKQYKLKYQETYEKHTELMNEYVLRQQVTEEMIQAKQEEIFSHDYIPAEYFRYVPTLITLLKSGRADTYKEALNMAIELERQEKIEEARQEEARQRAYMERQRAEEERRHNMEMERRQAEHDRAMERTAREQAEEQRRANLQAEKDRRRAESEAFHQKTVAESEARKQEAKTRSAGISKCANCRNSRRCPTHIKESGAGLTCGGYQPY